MSLTDRAEQLHGRAGPSGTSPQNDNLPNELQELPAVLARTYANLSIFRSAPTPGPSNNCFRCRFTAREKPTNLGSADLTCDSDGRLNRFCRWPQQTVTGTSSPANEPYLIGLFLSVLIK